MKFFLLVLLSTFILSANAKATESAIEIISKLGLEVVNNSPADFELLDLNNDNIKLSNYKGKWILLTFWATWCGPCRYELPELETLYQKFKDENLVVLGVSIDTTGKASVQKFLKQNKINFPNLLDPNNIAAGKYKATSVPIIFMISPDWKVVGIARGAQQWATESIFKNIGNLVKISQINDKLFATIPKGGDAPPKELPNNLTPPLLKIISSQSSYSEQETPTIEISVSWEGEASKYILKTPKLTVPDKVKVGKISSYSNSDIKNSTLHYKYPLSFNEPGNYAIGPVEISYMPRAGGKELFSRASEIQITITKSYQLIVIICSTLIFILLIIVVLFFIKRKKVTEETCSEQSSQLITEQEQNHLKQLKLNSSVAEYCSRLLELSLKSDMTQEEKSKAKKTLESLKFAGRQLTPSEIKYYEKSIFNKEREEE